MTNKKKINVKWETVGYVLDGKDCTEDEFIIRQCDAGKSRGDVMAKIEDFKRLVEAGFTE